MDLRSGREAILLVEDTYDAESPEIAEANEAELVEFKRVLAEHGTKVCVFDDMFACDGGAVDTNGVVHCVVWNGSHGGIACLRVRLKGGEGWGMTLYEKLKRQGLIK